jgi:DNA-binding transcriptional LysR family regulator
MFDGGSAERAARTVMPVTAAETLRLAITASPPMPLQAAHAVRVSIGAVSTPRRWAGLELRHLLALQAIAEHGSFHKAAAHLDYTQSGISQQIGALERIVGERLIERPGGSRPVRLTACGELLLRHAEAVFAQITAAQADVLALRDGAGGTLRVGAFQSVGAALLPRLMRRLATELPRLRVELTQTTSDPELFDLLDADELDLTFAELFADPFVAMVPAQSALAADGRRVSLRELGQLPLIAARGCRYTSHLEAQLRERGFEPNVVHRSDDNGTVQGLVVLGAGVAFVPRLVAEAAGGAVAIVEIAERLPPRRVALAWRKDRQLTPAREAFVHQVEQTCAALGLSPDLTRDSEPESSRVELPLEPRPPTRVR